MIQTYRRLGDLLVSRSAITNLQLAIALADQRISNRRLGEIVVERGYTTEYEVAACLAYQYGYPVVDPATLSPTADALSKLSAEDALTLRALPVEETDLGLVCAISDPIDVFSTDKLAALTRSRLILQVAPESSLTKIIRASYGLNEEDALATFPEAEFAPARFKALVSKSRAGSIATFDAFDTVLDRRVCLTATPESDRLELAHFQMVRGAAKAPTEGITAVFDSFVAGGHRWTVMERVSGESLERVLRMRGPRSVPQAASIVAKVAEIVDAIQRAGGTGTLIGPGNIFIQRGGPALTPLTLPPVDYLAPTSDFDGDMPGPASAYALGRLLKDCLYGIDSKGQVNLPAPMKDILANCLAGDPAERYGSAIEVASALRSYNWQALANPLAANTNYEREELLETLGDLPARSTATEARPIWKRLFRRKVA